MLRVSCFLPLSILIGSLALMASASPGHAQSAASLSTAAADNSSIERSRLPDPTLPLSAQSLTLGDSAAGGDTTSQALAPATSGDADLGVQSLLKVGTPRPQPWSIFADGGFVNTTNVALTKHHNQDDTFAVSEVGVGYEWRATDRLSLTATVRQQYFAYDRFDQLDFGALSAGAGLSYALPQNLLGGGLLISTQLSYTRLTARGFDNEFYRSGTLSFGAQKVITIGRAQLVSLGGDVLLGISVPHVPEREEFGLSSAYIVQLTRHLSLQAGGRAAYFDYADIDRNDFNLTLSGGATYAFTSWCSVGATISGTVNRSDRSVFDYNVFNSGASVFFRLRF